MEVEELGKAESSRNEFSNWCEIFELLNQWTTERVRLGAVYSNSELACNFYWSLESPDKVLHFLQGELGEFRR